MRVLILGGGVIGVTSAYYLAAAGHDVEVIDRRDAPAQETSFANAGQISPGYASPWAGAGVPLRALKWLAMRHGPLVLRPGIDVAMWKWLFQMLRNCTSARYATNKARMVPLAEYSRDCLRELRRTAAIAYDEGTGGTLQLFRTSRQYDGASRDIEVLRQFGVPFELLERSGCIEAEPALAHAPAAFVGGLRLPGDETGDCQLFTTGLAAAAAGLGVRFSYQTELHELVAEGSAVSCAMTSRGRRVADAYLVALGSHSTAALRRVGLNLPVYPVKGYSLTLPVADGSFAPRSTVMDETYKTAITRLGDRIRIGGTAEIAGFDMTLRPGRRRALEHSFNGLFPRGGDVGAAEYWCGLRPMTPDGPPILGTTPVGRLYLNTGHGTLGWTMACGSGRIIADIIDGKTPDIDAGGLTIARHTDRSSCQA